MSGEARIPESIDVNQVEIEAGLIFWMDEIGDTWADARAELDSAFALSKSTAVEESSIVYVVRNDDLLGRNGPTRAMVSSGLVSGARTAALEGSRKGWTANVIAYDPGVEADSILDQAIALLKNGAVTGELVHLGPGHLGKALI